MNAFLTPRALVLGVVALKLSFALLVDGRMQGYPRRFSSDDSDYHRFISHYV